MKPTVRLLIALPAALLLCIGASFLSFTRDCERLRESVLRLHILANSDSESDQADKLAVRDGLQSLFADVFADCQSVGEARLRAAENLPVFTEAARDILAERGCDLPVRAELVEEAFAATDYGDRVLPPGEYTAVRLTIGSAEGKNWFCVAFPPLCVGASLKQVPDADLALSERGGVWYVTRKDNGCTVRFKLTEWFEKLLKALRKH